MKTGKMNRAQRRKNKYKKIKKMFRILKRDPFYYDDEERMYYAKIMSDNPTICSCQSCRNPRRSIFYKGKSKLTVQERKAIC